ncbi:MAG TPA: hypothetical protein VFH68_17285 [Polyangia bacterium]|nr:hypothetical protein [Polyangia bacterium]
MRGKAIGLVMLLAAAIAGAGCILEPSVPGQPSYEADVKPILEARCIRCHGFPQVGGAPSRFDVYACPAPDGTTCDTAAKDHALAMVGRIKLDKDHPSHMPPKPAAPLSPYQIDTLDKWSKQNPPSP